MKKLVLKQRKNIYDTPYEVVSMEDTIEWNVGERLSQSEVKQILIRMPPHKVKVVIQ